MINEHEEPTTAKVVIQFTKSSSREGGVGHTIKVAEGATPEEAQRVYNIAWEMHCLALKDEADDQESKRAEAWVASRDAVLAAQRGRE